MSLRVVQLIDSLSTGGAEKLLLTYARQGRSRGIETRIICLRDRPGAILPRQLLEAGARLERLPGQGLIDLRRTLWLARWLRLQHIDVLHAHLEYATILGALAGWLAGVPVVASLHNTRRDRHEKIETLALRYGIRKIIAVGTAVADAYRPGLGGKSVEVLLNPVEIHPPLSAEERSALRSELAGDPRRPLLVSVGRLSPQKGYGDLLAAMDLLRKSRQDAFVAVAGTGSLHDELSAQIKACRLENNVRLLGLREDVPQILAAADLYISASLWEGLPVAVLEAMAAGLPIVATAVGDVPELLREERGLTVPPGQPELLAKAAGQLLAQPERARRLGAAAREYVMAHHRAESWFDALFKIYEDAARRA